MTYLRTLPPAAKAAVVRIQVASLMARQPGATKCKADAASAPTRQAASLLGYSVAEFKRMASEGLIGPTPTVRGSGHRWRYSDLLEWVATGRPNRDEWNQTRLNGDA